MTDSPKKVDWETEIKKAKMAKFDVRKKNYEAAKRARKAEAKN